ncbi:MAG: ABC transporter permease [Tissierellales bacterium]|nr:ABC transporter permease [Tissierellales bacterium]
MDKMYYNGIELTDDLFDKIPLDEHLSEESGYSNYSYWRSTFRTFFKSKLSIFLVVVILALSLFSFLYPVFSSTDPQQITLDVDKWNMGPNSENWFGTDGLGRDIWARTWYGTRNSLLLALVIAVIEVGVGSIIGAIWGYVRKMDRFMIELYNIITNIPSTVYLILLSYILEPSFTTIVIALASSGWIVEAKFMRNKVLSLRESEYNIASQCLGTPLRRVVSKNIIPHLISLIIMEAALTVPYSIGSEVFLGFIGLGLPLDTVTLGNMVNQGRANFMLYPYQMLYPTIVLCIITISFYIVGNKFADASDPKNHV